MSDDLIMTLFESLVKEDYNNRLQLQLNDVEICQESVEQSWFHPQKVETIFKKQASRKQYPFMSNLQLEAGKLQGEVDFKLTIEPESNSEMETDTKSAQKKNPLRIGLSFKTQSEQLSFPMMTGTVKGTITPHEYLKQAEYTVNDAKLQGFWLGQSMLVSVPELQTLDYIFNVKEDQIAKFDAEDKDVEQLILGHRNIFHESRFQLIFTLWGWFDSKKDTFTEIPSKLGQNAFQTPFESHRLLFESDHPLDSLLRAKGKISVWQIDPDNDTEEGIFKPLKLVNARCISSQKELMFDYCSLGDWKIRYIYPTEEMTRHNLSLL